jgi:voltage-gated potassium channel
MAPPWDRRPVGLAVLRSLATTALLVALYYLLPLNHLADVPLGLVLAAGLLILLVLTAWQLRLVLQARYPGVRAAEALATTVPLFLLLFASAYFVMERTRPGSFSHPLTRTDSMYFTVTTFSTVGFGDITAASQTARLTVTVQMILDLLALGLGLRLFIGAMRVARRARSDPADPATGGAGGNSGNSGAGGPPGPS